MTEGVLDQGPLRRGSPLRTPRAAAVAGIVFSVLMISALVLLRISIPAHPGDVGTWLTSTLALARNVTSSLLNVYSMRMAAVFTLSTVTIARRTQIVSRWLTVAGLAAALVLIIGIGISPWVELVFPAWILALSVDILAAGPRDASGADQALRGQLQA